MAGLQQAMQGAQSAPPQQPINPKAIAQQPGGQAALTATYPMGSPTQTGSGASWRDPMSVAEKNPG